MSTPGSLYWITYMDKAVDPPYGIFAEEVHFLRSGERFSSRTSSGLL